MPRLATTAESLIPPRPTLETLREAAAACRGCDLWKNATQTVFGDKSSQTQYTASGEDMKKVASLLRRRRKAA
ncbi:MAG TPA: hypothetical protein VEI49_07385 [Terriglobales bacterium]|nr:hypothetical protein [Terriglobales bacterium]